MKTRMILAGVATLAMGAVGTTTASARVATDTSNKTVNKDCLDTLTGQKQGVFTWSGPTASWPPNHKTKSATVTLTDFDSPVDDPADDVTLEVVGTHDELTTVDNVTTEQNGTGNTDPATDSSGGVGGGTGSASVPVSWRSERSGNGDGRTYTFTATGTTDGAGPAAVSTCQPVTFEVAVPHDQGKPKSAKRKRSARR